MGDCHGKVSCHGLREDFPCSPLGIPYWSYNWGAAMPRAQAHLEGSLGDV